MTVDRRSRDRPGSRICSPGTGAAPQRAFAWRRRRLVAGANPPRARALVSFAYRDPQGIEREAKAKLWLPDSLRSNPGAKVPLYFNAGYELSDGGEQDFVKRGWMVASPRDLPSNPLIRTANPDIALLHIVRSLAFVDDRHVIIVGGSAGGYMTLLLAAETFPLAGAASDVPPVNWGYNAAYFFDADGQGGTPG